MGIEPSYLCHYYIIMLVNKSILGNLQYRHSGREADVGHPAIQDILKDNER